MASSGFGSGSLRRKGLHITENDLACKNRCGFYGNPAWEGYCSKCFREHKGKTDIVYQNFANLKDDSQSNVTAKEAQAESSAFAKFEEKRHQQKSKRSSTAKLLFQRKHQRSTSKEKEKALTTQSLPAPIKPSPVVENELSQFLRASGISKSATVVLAKRISTLIHEIKYRADIGIANIDQFSETVLQFYSKIFESFRGNDYRGISDETLRQLVDLVEKHVFSLPAIYRILFSPNEDEEKDLELQSWIRSLHWITPELVESSVSIHNATCQAAMDEAIAKIFDLQSVRSPLDKLELISQCCESLMQAIKDAKGGPASADEFLPSMIYLILRANPPLLVSNLQYITRFTEPSHLQSGQIAYFFTNLSCAVSYIERINAESMNLTSEEFDKYMKGEAFPEHSVFDDNLPDGIRLMKRNLIQVVDISDRQTAFEQEIAELGEDIRSFHSDLHREMAQLDQRMTDKLAALRMARVPAVPAAAPSQSAATLTTDTAFDTSITSLEANQLPSPLKPEPITRTAAETGGGSDGQEKINDSVVVPPSLNEIPNSKASTASSSTC